MPMLGLLCLASLDHLCADLTTPLHFSFQEAAARALCNLACDCHNMIAVAEGGAIGPLVELLKSSSITCCEAAAWALKNIACHEENASWICEAGGIQGLVSLLNRHISETHLYTNALLLNTRRRLIEATVSALGALTYTEENKSLIGQLGAIGSMILFIIEEDSSDRFVTSPPFLPLLTFSLSVSPPPPTPYSTSSSQVHRGDPLRVRESSL
jgi:hypothetical protein